MTDPVLWDFGWPEGLRLLALLPPFLLLLLGCDLRRARRTRGVLGARADSLADLGPRRRFWRRIVGTAGLALACLASAQPLGRIDARRFAPRGIDVALCLDASWSMLAGDQPPDRLTAAVREIQDLVGLSRGDRFALVAFAKDARVIVPWTTDGASLAEMAGEIGPDRFSRGGSDVGAAVELALALLGQTPRGSGAIVLLSDGEDSALGGDAAARRCAELGMPLHAVAFGTPVGAKIPVGPSGFLRDADGAEIVTRSDAGALARWARTAGGMFVDGGAESRPLRLLHERALLPMRSRAFADAERRSRESLYQWPLLLAVLLWMLEAQWRERRPR
ncbi:MAG: VWA domain-containing protein [Planctomycetota bacterium]